jgi:peroxiredoxin
MKHLKVGDKAPDFNTTDQNGEAIFLGDFAGREEVGQDYVNLAAARR